MYEIKRAIAWFFTYQESDSLNNLKERFSEQIGERIEKEGGEEMGYLYSMIREDQIAVELFLQNSDENPNLLDWLTLEDAETVADMFGLPND